jgi:hypothetical protein
MAKKRGFVRYTKKGKLVPGSLVVTTSGGYPDKSSLWSEVLVDLCCNTILLSFDTSEVDLINEPVFMSVNCGDIPVFSPSFAFPVGITLDELVSGLNEAIGWMGTFSYEGTVVFFDIKKEIADAMCPSGNISFIIGNFTAGFPNNFSIYLNNTNNG